MLGGGQPVITAPREVSAAPAFVDVLAVEALLGGSPSPSRAAVVAATGGAVRDVVERVYPGPPSSTTSPAPSMPPLTTPRLRRPLILLGPSPRTRPSTSGAPSPWRSARSAACCSLFALATSFAIGSSTCARAAPCSFSSIKRRVRGIIRETPAAADATHSSRSAGTGSLLTAAAYRAARGILCLARSNTNLDGRVLADVPDVERLLAIVERPWPDRSSPVLSFSMRGLWQCNATRSEFPDWWPALLRKGLGREGVHYVKGCGVDDTEDVFVAVVFGLAVAHSTTVPGREAARIISRAILDLFPIDGAGASARPSTELLVRAAVDAAERPSSRPESLISMVDGGLRVITPPDDVSPALDIFHRRFGSRSVLTASIPGLWSCTESTRQPAAWFARAAGALGLVDGRDYFPRPDLPAGGPAFVDALAIQALVGGSRSPSHQAVVTVAARTIREAVEGPMPPPAHAGADPEPVGLATGPDPVGAEPWDEAFDFGRLVPVSEREVGGVLQPTVSARDVHTFLAVGRDFPTWFAAEVERRKLRQGPDYEIFNFPRSGEIKRRGGSQNEYALSLSAAKEIGMAGDGPRSKAVRRYFIEQERRFLAGEPPLPGSVPPARQPPADRSAIVDDQSADPLFMPFASYLAARGLPHRQARKEAASAGPEWAAWMIGLDAGSHLRLVPGLGWTFTVPFLDEWWGCNRTRLLSAAAGIPPKTPTGPSR
jgi:phage anti-repressor protein